MDLLLPAFLWQKTRLRKAKAVKLTAECPPSGGGFHATPPQTHLQPHQGCSQKIAQRSQCSSRAEVLASQAADFCNLPSLLPP